MYNILKRNWDKTKYILLSGFIIIFLLLLTVVYKSDEKISTISENNKNLYDVSDLKTFKQFILDQIKSSGVEVIIFDNILVEPTLKSLEVASQFALENSFDLIVAE